MHVCNYLIISVYFKFFGLLIKKKLIIIILLENKLSLIFKIESKQMNFFELERLSLRSNSFYEIPMSITEVDESAEKHAIEMNVDNEIKTRNPTETISGTLNQERYIDNQDYTDLINNLSDLVINFKTEQN